MSVITLSPLFSEEKIEEFNKSPQLVTEEMLKLKRFFQNHTLTKDITATFESAVGDNGIHYDSIEFIVVTRYTSNGDFWVAGHNFQLNLDALIREMESLLK